MQSTVASSLEREIERARAKEKNGKWKEKIKVKEVPNQENGIQQKYSLAKIFSAISFS